MNVGLYGKGSVLCDHKPRFTITRFPGDLGVFEKHGNEGRKPDTRAMNHREDDRSMGQGTARISE